jgi:hypothetical protein
METGAQKIPIRKGSNQTGWNGSMQKEKEDKEDEEENNGSYPVPSQTKSSSDAQLRTRRDQLRWKEPVTLIPIEPRPSKEAVRWWWWRILKLEIKMRLKPFVRAWRSWRGR